MKNYFHSAQRYKSLNLFFSKKGQILTFLKQRMDVKKRSMIAYFKLIRDMDKKEWKAFESEILDLF